MTVIPRYEYGQLTYTIGEIIQEIGNISFLTTTPGWMEIYDSLTSAQQNSVDTVISYGSLSATYIILLSTQPFSVQLLPRY